MGAGQSAATVTQSDASGARVHLDSIRRLVKAGFDEFEQAGEADDGEDLLEVLCGVHELEQSLFLFCWLPDHPEPVGFALFFRYSDALYASTLCVSPSCRRRGLGSLLMRSGSALAFSMGLPKLTGSVDAAAQHLVRTVVCTLHCIPLCAFRLHAYYARIGYPLHTVFAKAQHTHLCPHECHERRLRPGTVGLLRSPWRRRQAATAKWTRSSRFHTPLRRSLWTRDRA